MIRSDSAPSASLLDIVHTLRSAGCVYAEDEAELLTAAFDGVELEDMVNRRVSGTPLEQLLGWAEFCGIRIAVGPGVFVPRRRTELLVEQAASLPIETVVDICCGSGAVGAALASELPGIELHCADVDPVALEFARINIASLGGQVHEGDLYAALPVNLRGNVDVVLANAPYVPTDEIGSMPSEARDHEPIVALDGGVDGLAVQRRVAADAPRWLVPGGHLLIETSALQAPETASLVREAGFDTHVVRSDELDATVVVGTCGSGR
ncbi:putative protein N(5)-glutamine methyltransferase [Rhodococcus sp. 1168]|uniref:putative protein N(5)-glutamine methyltransferase n=1 Tax=Rhodococcus sp. 1168 TaxID=2018041 RepID=UPI000A0EC376|nr:putative protein N(5)-glutamine methyltransferase [Rhodococcus sp. 1168]ORI15750.1 hypothetical protein BJI47_05175 [Rhodococcus sp. 1168]